MLAAMGRDPREGAAMSERSVQISELREDLERLVLLEQVAANRQLAIEKRLNEVAILGITAEQLRKELDLSKDSIDKLLALDAPGLAERLGLSQETVEKLEP
jgi:hypothetical protein